MDNHEKGNTLLFLFDFDENDKKIAKIFKLFEYGYLGGILYDYINNASYNCKPKFDIDRYTYIERESVSNYEQFYIEKIEFLHNRYTLQPDVYSENFRPFFLGPNENGIQSSFSIDFRLEIHNLFDVPFIKYNYNSFLKQYNINYTSMENLSPNIKKEYMFYNQLLFEEDRIGKWFVIYYDENKYIRRPGIINLLSAPDDNHICKAQVYFPGIVNPQEILNTDIMMRYPFIAFFSKEPNDLLKKKMGSIINVN